MHRFRRIAFLLALFPWVNCFVYGAVDPGEILIAEMGCIHCHDAPAPIRTRLNSRPAPRLGKDGLRLTRTWIRDFLRDPHRAKPGTLMPDLLHGMADLQKTETADDLAAYLVSLAPPVTGESDPAGLPQTNLSTGDHLYHTLGCVACHAPFHVPKGQNADASSNAELEHLQKQAIPIGPLRGRLSIEELARFLVDPLATKPGGRMPSLSLSKAESVAIAAFLHHNDRSIPQEESTTPESPDLARIERGKQWFTSLNCAACHQIGEPGIQARPMAHLQRRQPAGCLSAKPKPGIPKFELTDRQRIVIQSQIMNQDAWNVTLTDEQQIRRTLAILNCYACHSRDRRGGPLGLQREFFTATENATTQGDDARFPPRLDDVGAKFHAEGLRATLVDSHKLRPYMATRMPLYGAANVEHIVHHFVTADVKPDVPIVPPAAPDTALGQKLLSAAGYACLKCHDNQSGIDLRIAVPRLRWDWFRSFMTEPMKRFPTRTPHLFHTQTGPVVNLVDGDVLRHVGILWHTLHPESAGRKSNP